MTKHIEPKWLKIARTKIGTLEYAGAKSNPTIMGWAAKVGSKVLGIPYQDDSVPWCGLFAAAVLEEAGLKERCPPIAVRASAWAKAGLCQALVIDPSTGHVTGFKPMTIRPGMVLTFTRNGGGHVGFYVSEDRDNYHVLGGNQGDMVSITKIAKSRLTAFRWIGDFDEYDAAGGPVIKTLKGTVSRNEA